MTKIFMGIAYGSPDSSSRELTIVPATLGQNLTPEAAKELREDLENGATDGGAFYVIFGELDLGGAN